MPEDSQYVRLLDEDETPDEGSVLDTIGEPSAGLWSKLREFLREGYDFEPELVYYGKKYGWCYRYRRKKKTLCTIFPETGAFTVLVTLGKKEVEGVESILSTLNQETQRIFKEARQYHDGKWIYRRVLNEDDLADIVALLKVKKRPSS
ncbi:MAG: DUF3788 domain-containing protein [Candidatus Thermoplasmatota archaeon]|nr:DUF3788 domain-containing protein [Candidatus Thermoplasmatota archaeon]